MANLLLNFDAVGAHLVAFQLAAQHAPAIVGALSSSRGRHVIHSGSF